MRSGEQVISSPGSHLSNCPSLLKLLKFLDRIVDKCYAESPSIICFLEDSMTLRILLIGDDDSYGSLIHDMLKEAFPAGFDLDRAGDCESALEHILEPRDPQYDVCLLNDRLGDNHGVDILWEAKLADFKTPIIFMSEEGELRHDLSAMRAGAVDFIEKSQVTSRLLARSIRYAVQRKRSEEDLRKHIIFLEHLVEARTRELLDEQNRLRALVDSIVDEVWFCDATGRILLANTAATAALGFENEQDLLSTISELMPKLQIHAPDGRAKSRREVPILKSVRGEVVKNEEETIRHPKTGEVHHKHVSSAPVKNESGEIIGAVAIIRDVTERKRMEIALREGAQLLQSVLEALPVGVWITDRDGKIIQGNPAGREIWGGARYVGVDHYHEYKCWWADNGEPISPEESALARAVLHGETSLNEEVEIEGFDGLRRIILNSALPVCDSEQQVLAAIGVNQDITARKKAEREREKLIAKLRESLANIRTLKGLLPICAWCKKIRDDQGYWNQLESYITSHFEVGITHGICPECAEKISHELHGLAPRKPKA